MDGPRLGYITLAAPVFIAVGVLMARMVALPILLLIAAALVGVGFACSNAPSTQLVLRFAPKQLRALSTSLDITCARLGGVASIALFATAGGGLVVLGIMALSLVAMVCAWSICRDAP